MNDLKPESSTQKQNFGPILALVTLLVLIALFIITGVRPPESPEPTQSLKPEWYTPKTARVALLKNKPLVGNCFICHALWVKIPDPQVIQPEFAHPNIKLEHGINNRCYNCHLISDRNKYAADNGSGIMHTNVEKLCARCHGLIYKDWESGTHGIRRGKWLVNSRFDRQIFTCTECHNPHSPVFKFTEFAPPPVWPDKFIRAVAEEHDPGGLSEYLIENN